MSLEPIVPGTPSPGVTPVPPATPATPAPAAPNAGVPNPEIAELKTVVADLQKQVSFAVAKLTKTPPAKPPESAPAIAPPTLERQHEDLKKMQAVVFGQAKNAAIIAAAASKTGDMTEHFKKYVSAVYGENIEVTEDAKVMYREGETLTPIATWIDAFLKTDEGGKFVPAKAAAKTEGLTGTQAATTQSADEIFGTATYGELMANPKLFAKALKADPVRMEKLRIEDDRARAKNRK